MPEQSYNVVKDPVFLITLKSSVESKPMDLEISCYEIQPNFDLTTECLQGNFTLGNGSVFGDPYTWLQTVGTDVTDYYFYQGTTRDTWMEPSRFYNRYFHENVPEMHQMLSKFSNMLMDIEASFDDTEENVIVVSTETEQQFYNPDIPEESRDGTSGLPLYVMEQDPETSDFVEAGSCRLALFTRTGYNQGTPVTYQYCSGLYNIVAQNTIPSNAYRSASYYDTNYPAALAFYTFNMVVDGETSPEEIRGQTKKFLLMCIRESYLGNYRCRFQIYSLNSLSGDERLNPPTTDDNEQTSTPAGWGGGFDYSSDEDTVLPITGHSFANRWAHGLRTYYISDQNVDAMMRAVWDTTLTEYIELSLDAFINRKNTDFMKGVVFLHKLPLAPWLTTSGAQHLTILGNDLSESYSGLNAFPILSQQTVQISSFQLSVPSTYKQTFMDLNHAGAYVRLPFIGNVPVDIKHIRDGALYVNYNIDCITGNLVAMIYAKTPKIDANHEPKWILIYQGSGNCAIPIPFSGNSEGGFRQLGTVCGIANSAMSTITSTIGNAAMGGAMGAVGAVGSAVSGATNIMSQIANYASTNTAEYNYVASEATSLSNLAVRLVIYGDVPVVPPKQREIVGYTASTTGLITNFKDTGMVYGTTHADKIPRATDAEKREIERLFAGGVIV